MKCYFGIKQEVTEKSCRNVLCLEFPNLSFHKPEKMCEAAALGINTIADQKMHTHTTIYRST